MTPAVLGLVFLGALFVLLFILMGELATASRLSAELFSAARVCLFGLRGGLSVATIVASGGFGAISGSSVATAATMTRIALPEMRNLHPWGSHPDSSLVSNRAKP